MSHSYVQNLAHVVFSTKGRARMLPPEFQPKLWAYMAGICKNIGVIALGIGGTDDHAHLLIQVPPTLPLAKAVLTIKANSTRWGREQGKRMEWQKGYAGFSVSASNVAAVEKYIKDQEAHHKRMSFDQEFIALLRKHGVEFDPKFVLG